MNKLFLTFGLLVVAFTFTGCEEQVRQTDQKQAQQTEMVQDRLNTRFGLPAIVNGQEKRLVKELYELRDQADLITYTYTFSEMTGELRYLGKSMGFGIPASVQYSNPQKEIYEGGYNRGFGSMPLAEPNGLFMPEGLSATWVYLINPILGQADPTYVEPLITVSMYPLEYAKYPGGEDQFRNLAEEYRRSKQ